jgi:hypothetical protein
MSTKYKPSELNSNKYQMDLTDICRIFYPTATNIILLNTANGSFSK